MLKKYYEDFRRPYPSDLNALQGIEDFSEFITDVRVCSDNALLIEVSVGDDTFVTGASIFALASRFAVALDDIAIDPGYTNDILELVVYRGYKTLCEDDGREPTDEELDAIEASLADDSGVGPYTTVIEKS